MSGRDAILQRIRNSLNGESGDEARRKTVDARLAGHPSGVVPARGHLPKSERVALFQSMAEKANATVMRVSTKGAVPEAVRTYLRRKNLPADIRMGSDPRLAELDWTSSGTLTVKTGASDGEDLTAVSQALGGIAESGTLALTSGEDNPTTLNLLPEHHIVVLTADDILPDLESFWPILRKTHGAGTLPRTVNLVTGPSRSGDIEQVLLLGAHGPRSVHIIIVES